MDKLIASIRHKTTDQILECVMLLAGTQAKAEARMVRAALIEVYMEREGEEAADALMDTIGL